MTVASPSVADRRGCAGVTVDGQPCRSVIVSESGYCYAHDPDKVEERNVARARGGVNSSNAKRLRRQLGTSALGPVFDLLEKALSETHIGEVPPARAQAMASVARAMVAVLEAGQLEERLEQLEFTLLA